MTTIEIGECELAWDGHRIWLNAAGGNVLRVKCTGRVIVDEACRNPVAHSDICVEGDLNLCVPSVKLPME